jgi:hypothetical protein
MAKVVLARLEIPNCDKGGRAWSGLERLREDPGVLSSRVVMKNRECLVPLTR